ncbi:D-alanyl-D-alanine carboxypeptidase/D-alanyl-D-alanine endopeptidase [Amycolatopsis pithecellobii]|uniref:D-alanyl-D-alanine carboxypeptidase/D-alanyl-D-alanine-endopeptidase n=1 Tax=Amycolatopsis pithecellobii TaxID=664692 RepID=A0A6N7Z933_9PSEU|nr:D-alanyl-D-alanine carboxypeptidase/D-alanyl-D-alanine-endopeptidase [Amycolatopsis pithecellobii]MTD57896.1 D-alanyl-D-alanine carboxypeptidase/D-alanyl-D-alanine-endopeptidase [Amycolatopsis pithecellobii]
MPPHDDEPAWPSDDSDVSGAGTPGEQPAEKPAEKPEKPAGESAKETADGGATAHLPLPKVSLPEQPTLFVPVAEKPKGDEEKPKPEPTAEASSEERTAFLPVVKPIPQQVTAPVQQPRPVPPPQRPVPPAGLVHAQPMRIEPSGQVRPAETAVPPQPPGEPPAPPAEPRKRRRGLLIGGALVLVLVVAAGVASAVPYVSNRLGLPWAPNLPKGDTPEPAAVTLALQPPSASAPTPTASGISSALGGPAANSALGTLAGVVVDPANGATLWNHNSGQLLTPASATKLLTSTAALLKLDHGFQISTKVVQGASPDTAIIVAGGDPTLSSLPVGKESVYPGAAHLDELVAQVKKASGGAIKKVQLDPSLYIGQPTAPGWAPEDAPSTYAVPVVPGMLDGGRSNPTVDEIARTGDPGNALLQTFAQRLGATAAGNVTAPKGAKVLGEVRSAPLTELVDNLLQISDNNLAEAVGRQTAIASGAPATFAGVAQTTLNILAQNGFDVSGAVLNDGSGLSTLNKVSPKLLAQLLTVAAAPDARDPRTVKLRPILEGLPVAGGSGTLADRYNTPNSSTGKGWVRAKTGTLSGVNTLAGVVLDKDGRALVFAMMSNGSNVLEARPALDAVAATLRGCGCR